MLYKFICCSLSTSLILFVFNPFSHLIFFHFFWHFATPLAAGFLCFLLLHIRSLWFYGISFKVFLVLTCHSAVGIIAFGVVIVFFFISFYSLLFLHFISILIISPLLLFFRHICNWIPLYHMLSISFFRLTVSFCFVFFFLFPLYVFYILGVINPLVCCFLLLVSPLLTSRGK